MLSEDNKNKILSVYQMAVDLVNQFSDGQGAQKLLDYIDAHYEGISVDIFQDVNSLDVEPLPYQKEELVIFLATKHDELAERFDDVELLYILSSHMLLMSDHPNIKRSHTDHCYNMATLYQQKGDEESAQRVLEEAKQACLQILDVDRSDEFVSYHSLFLICNAMSRTEEAKRYLDKAEAINPQDYQVLWNQAYIALQEENYERAGQYMHRYLDLFGRDREKLAVIFDKSTWFLNEKKDLVAAQLLFSMMHDRFPLDGGVTNNLAITYWRRSKEDRESHMVEFRRKHARDLFREAIKIGGDQDHLAEYNLGQMYYEEKNSKLATYLFQKVADAQGDFSKSSHAFLAKLFQDKADLYRATWHAIQASVIKLATEESPAHYQFADLYFGHQGYKELAMALVSAQAGGIKPPDNMDISLDDDMDMTIGYSLS